MRRIANEFMDHACVGETIQIDGETMPYRPVAVTLGKTVNNGWGGFECCWARTLLATLVGALEVPGGTIGTTVRLTRPMSHRHESVKPGPDGFMHFPFNPTDKAHWSPSPNIRNAYRTMVPLAADGPWSQALGPTHFSWLFLDETPKGLPRVTLPDVWFVYRTNPAISFWDTKALGEKIARFPFMVGFAYTMDETNHFADVLLPDATDLESLQLWRIGGTKYQESFWDHEGFALRQPVGGHARPGARLHRHRHRTGAAHRPVRQVLLGHQQGRGRRAAERRTRRLLAGPARRLTAASRSGTRCAAPRVPRSATARFHTGSTGGRSMAWRPGPTRSAAGTCCRPWSSTACASSCRTRSG